MFGHQDEPKQTPTDTNNPSTSEPVSDGTLDGDFTSHDSAVASAPAIEAHETDGFTDVGAATVPSGNDTSNPTDDVPLPNPAPAASPATDANALLDIKQQALQQLSPLVDHLDQDPEEKFRTTMMMIQASDNKDLLKTAYAAAQAITDDKARAQALLDVINEINYFTQHAE